MTWKSFLAFYNASLGEITATERCCFAHLLNVVYSGYRIVFHSRYGKVWCKPRLYVSENKWIYQVFLPSKWISLKVTSKKVLIRGGPLETEEGWEIILPGSSLKIILHNTKVGGGDLGNGLILNFNFSGRGCPQNPWNVWPKAWDNPVPNIEIINNTRGVIAILTSGKKRNAAIRGGGEIQVPDVYSCSHWCGVSI